jgi:hypothetical protein
MKKTQEMNRRPLQEMLTADGMYTKRALKDKEDDRVVRTVTGNILKCLVGCHVTATMKQQQPPSPSN